MIYADDTLLAGQDTRTMNLLIAAIETDSRRYGMRLNKGKCIYFVVNGKANIHFTDRSKLKHDEETKYLGGVIARKHLTRK